MAVCEDSKALEEPEIEEKPTPLHSEKLEKEDLAPDGGWGWMIAVGLTVATLVTISQGASFGLIYGDFLNASGSGGSALTVLNLMIMISVSATGLVCNNLLKKYSIKPVGIIGASIYATANTLICFVPNVTFMAVSFFAQGIGIGLMMTVCTISFNAYFVKRRTLVMGITQVIIGLGGIIYPFLIEKMLRAYGFRGCLALLGAISFNGVAVMLMMDPVEWHYKKLPDISQKISANEDREMGTESGDHNLVIPGKKVDPIRRHSMDISTGWEKNRSVRSLRAEAEHENPLLNEVLKASHRSQDRNHSAFDISTGFRSRPGKGSNIDLLAKKLSMSAAASTSSINRISGFSPIPVAAAKNKDVDRRRKSIRSILADFFEVSLLRDGPYVNMCIGSSLTFLTDILFNSFFPMILTNQGYATADIALALTVGAVTELVGKILFAVFSTFVKIKARHAFLFCLYCLVICRIAFLYCNTLLSILIVHGFSGLARSLSMVNQVLIFAEHVKIERFPAAWGLFTVINGCTAVVVCPLIGLVKDLTQSYVVTQYVLLGGLFLCLTSWTIEILILEVFARKKIPETVNQK